MLQAFTARSKCSKSQVICLRAACHDGDGWSCFEKRLSSKAGIKGLSKFVIQAVFLVHGFKDDLISQHV